MLEVDAYNRIGILARNYMLVRYHVDMATPLQLFPCLFIGIGKSLCRLRVSSVHCRPEIRDGTTMKINLCLSFRGQRTADLRNQNRFLSQNESAGSYISTNLRRLFIGIEVDDAVCD